MQSLTCTGNGNVVDNAGSTYQELSRLTGGLRFPLPPPPSGSTLDLANVAVQYEPGDGTERITFGQAPAAADCRADTFFISGGRLNLCPDSCSRVHREPTASISVLFTCESQLIVPR